MLKKELMQKAKELKIKGRSKMTKEELLKAIMEIEGVEGDGEKKEMKQPKIDKMYKVDTPPPTKKVTKSSPKASPRPSPKKPKMTPKMQSQLKAKMTEVASESKKS
jgi:hypothetical protein